MANKKTTMAPLEPSDHEMLVEIHRQLTQLGGVGNPTILARLQAVENAVNTANQEEPPNLYRLVKETRDGTGTAQGGPTLLGALEDIRNQLGPGPDTVFTGIELLQTTVEAVQTAVGQPPQGSGSVFAELGTIKTSVGVGEDSIFNKLEELKTDVGTVQTSVGSPRDGRSVIDELSIVKTSVGVDTDSVLYKIEEVKFDVAAVQNAVGTPLDGHSVLTNLGAIKGDIGTVQASVGAPRDGRSVLDELSIVKTSVGIDDGSVLNKIAELKADVGTVQSTVTTGTASVLEKVAGVKEDVATVQVSVDNGTVTVIDQITELKGDVGTVRTGVVTVQDRIGTPVTGQTVLADLGTVKSSVGAGPNSVLNKVDDVHSIVSAELRSNIDNTIRSDLSIIKSIVIIGSDQGDGTIIQRIATAVGAMQGETTNHTMLTQLKQHFHVGIEEPWPDDPQY